ncbi:MAG: Nif3-like dinuclear metal center hexameric protein [Cytophagales bacterium]|nr:Nif3-like dinuclear metal center hexameric protein [Cytophagales bacterium]
MKAQELIDILESWAPPAYQESYDNVGVLWGDPAEELKGVLLTLDLTEEVLDEAVARDCNWIVAHHPILFKALKRLSGGSYVERILLKALRKGIGVYALHTNLDNIREGVNQSLASLLELEQVCVLEPKVGLLSQLTFFCPKNDVKAVLRQVHDAGAGRIGNYDFCSFQQEGRGYFRPGSEADPRFGRRGELTEVEEVRVEVLVPVHIQDHILAVLKRVHPYEEVAYFSSPLYNAHQGVGMGQLGILASPLSVEDFLGLLKRVLSVSCLRYTGLGSDRMISRVAICGGSGSSLLGVALRRGADAYVTSDIKYHEFFDAEGKILFCDIGHYESESHVKSWIFEYLRDKLHKIALHVSEVDTNPISYA